MKFGYIGKGRREVEERGWISFSAWVGLKVQNLHARKIKEKKKKKVACFCSVVLSAASLKSLRVMWRKKKEKEKEEKG